MLTATLANMRSEAATLVNLPEPTASTRVTIATANNWVNRGLRELFLIALNAAGEGAYRKTWTLDTTGSPSGTYAWPLPLDFYSLKSVTYLLGGVGGDRMVLNRLEPSERAWLLSASPGWYGQPFRYDLAGKSASDGTDPGTIELLPPPSGGMLFEILYVYAPPTLVNDANTFDGFAGFDDYAVVYAARRMAMMTEQRERAGELGAELERLKANVLANMRQRDGAQAPRVNMTRDAFTQRSQRYRRLV